MPTSSGAKERGLLRSVACHSRGTGGRSLALLVLVVVALAGIGGCTSSSEGEAMRHDIADLRTRLDAIDKRDAEYKQQVVRLKKVLEEATALLTRNSADVGAKAAKNESDIAVLTGRIEELTHTLEPQLRQATADRSLFEARLAALEQTQSKIADKVALTLPDDKEQLWSQAGSRLAAGQRDEGRRFYRTFIQRFPQDPRAPQAYLVIGQSYSQENKFPNAAAEFQKVLDNYSSSPEVPEAMWQLALTFSQLKYCTDARALLSDLVRRYPKSPRAPDAKNQIKQLAKLPRSACTS